MFQEGSNSRVCQNGWISNSFPLGRGGRQGDLISPYIFIICAELFSQAIKNCRDIRGLEINGVENKLTQYADDTTLFLDGSKKSLSKTISILDSFEMPSA